MASKAAEHTAESATLARILSVLQDILILQAANAGIGKEDARRIAGVSSARVSRVWKNIKKTKGA